MSDIAELTELCLSAHSLQSAAAKAPLPLDETHIPASNAADVVSLASIGGLSGVGRIPASQTLSFGDSPGLTVVYGGNGAGKSSYARVLKKACRSRGSAPAIRPNAFSTASSAPAKGQIAFKAGDSTESHAWTDGGASDPRLGSVFIFDSAAADNYLEQDGPASFTPFGLDVLPKLSKACDAVKAEIQKEVDRTQKEIDSGSAILTARPDTSVGKITTRLAATTNEAPIVALAVMTEADTKRLGELGDLLRSNPKQKAKETRAAVTRLKHFHALAKTAESALSEVEFSSARTKIEEAKSSAQAAHSFAGGAFDSAHLVGTGSEFWRKMWESAREYSVKSIYAGKDVPPFEEGSKCPLCQEELSTDGAARMEKFQSFYADASQRLAEEAAQKLKETRERFGAMKPLAPEYAKIETDMGAATQQVVEQVAAYVRAADEALALVQRSLNQSEWGKPQPLSPLSEGTIAALVAGLEKRAAEEEAADDPAARKKLEEEHAELADREWLGKSLPSIRGQIGRHKRIAALVGAQKDTSTNAITLLNTTLTERLVTSAFKERFKAELEELGLRTIGAELKDIKGSKGQMSFGIRLSPGSPLPVAHVASEGEYRCIALAAFLAELSQMGSRSALVFDDPVSSLDHDHRLLIAKRLVREAKQRQVVVFTHDAVFLNDLCAEAQEGGVPGTYLHLAWNGREPGHCYSGLPWDCKSPEERLDNLEQRCNPLAAVWSAQPSEDNIAQMRSAYSWLRQTIERVVEKVIFADVVFRYRSYINLKNLSRVVGFDHSELSEIERLFKKCCDVTDAHDAPQGRQAPVPTPAQLRADVDAVKTLVKRIRDRQKPTPAQASV